MVERKANKSGEDTRTRIIEAALDTVRAEGLVGTSARVIARTGGFNQALVFYHFGSIDELLLAALERANDRRLARFRGHLDAVHGLPGIIEVALQMHVESDDADFAAITAIVAGWSVRSEGGSRILEILKPWDDLIAGAVSRSLAGTPYGSVAQPGDLAHALSALFFGLELMSRLEVDSGRTVGLYSSLASGAEFLSTGLEEASKPEE